MVIRVGFFEALEGPFGYLIRDGAREVEGREGVETLDVASLADSRDAGPVAGAVSVMDLLYHRPADRFLRLADAAGRFDARDGCDEARAGDPEGRRHVSGPLVLYDARQAEGTAGCDAERTRLASELPGNGGVVFRGIRHHTRFQASGYRHQVFVGDALCHEAKLCPGRWRFRRKVTPHRFS
jgi:hypothetical protein